MGYLKLNSDALMDFSRVVISVWYRIPAASADVVRAAFNSFVDNDYQGMVGVVPLLTFGSQQTDTLYDLGTVHIHADPGYPPPCNNGFDGDVGPAVVGSHTAMTPPSYIGVMYGGGSLEGVLQVYLQTDQFPSPSPGFRQSPVGWVAPVGPSCAPGYFTYSDISYVDAGAHVAFSSVYGPYRQPNWSGITTDAWHHLLISWDLGGVETAAHNNGNNTLPGSAYINSNARMWLAHDRVNKNGLGLPVPWVYGDNEDGNPNLICADIIGGSAGANGSGSISCGVHLPADSLCIPGPDPVFSDGAATSPVQNVEMAELQIYTGVTCDTSNPDVVKWFVTTDGKPVDPRTAIKGLRKSPDVLIAGKASNWTNGINLGSAGGFDIQGTITEYSTGPQL